MPKTYDKKAWLEQKELTKEENLKIIQNIDNIEVKDMNEETVTIRGLAIILRT